MSDEKALLAAIWEHPHEDTPRLVYADWLQENGQPERAEFIRIQIELARLEWLDRIKRPELSQREQSLLRKHGASWRRGLSSSFRSVPFERGFLRPPVRTFTGERFLALPPGAFDAAPAWAVNLSSSTRLFDRIANSPNLERVGWLTLKGKSDGRELDLLAASSQARHIQRLECELRRGTKWLAQERSDAPGLASLSSFRLTGQLSGRQVATLASSPLAPCLTYLDLVGSALGNEGASALARADRFPKLEMLCVARCGLGAEELRILLDSETVTRVRPIIRQNPIGDRGLEVLLKSNWIEGIKDQLDLSEMDLTDVGVAALARWRGLKKITVGLKLDRNRIGVAGVVALVNSPDLKRCLLGLVRNPLNESVEAIRALREWCAKTGGRVHLTRTAVTKTEANGKWAFLLG